MSTSSLKSIAEFGIATFFLGGSFMGLYNSLLDSRVILLVTVAVVGGFILGLNLSRYLKRH